MIYSGRIRKTLKFLDREYDKADSRHKDLEIPVLYAKLAILEYCGWLESAFDEIARNCVRHKLRTAESRKVLEDRIKTTHGFTYQNHVRPLLAYGLGVIRLAQVERELEKTGELSLLKSHLKTINESRKKAAHTFTSGRTSRFDAPSKMMENLEKIRPTLQNLWELAGT